MNEKLIQNKLQAFWDKKGHKVICPNFTPVDWFECDLFTLTKGNRFYECEIKLTREDFKRDSLKSHSVPNIKPPGAKGPLYTQRYKHQELSNRCESGPAKFYFVTPEGMLKDHEIPEWAGLITFNARLKLNVKIEAPQLHRKAISSDHIERMGRVFYYRFWALRAILERKQTIKKTTNPKVCLKVKRSFS